VGTHEAIYVEVERRARQPPFAKGVEAFYVEVAEGFFDLTIIDHYLVPCIVNGPPLRYDISYCVGDVGVSKPKSDYFLACRDEVVVVLD
jgi:hypothetical protein